MDVATTAEVEGFYFECPASSVEAQQQIAEFFRHHAPNGRLERPVVCVTSGGTTVPMERNCVRYIDNFSAGTRGAMSTQEFLEAGYAVIFLTRTGSVQPWTLDLPKQDTVALLQEIIDRSDSGGDIGGGSGARLAATHEESVLGVLRRVAAVQERRLLLTIQFTTIFEYLQCFRAVALAAAPYGAACMFYLAAAVSDFYIPWASLAVHKIQSADGPLALNLSKVPKMLGVLRRSWAPGAFVVSFKLETDESILLAKASGAVTRYGVHAVVANLLHTRKDRVMVVHGGGSGDGGSSSSSGGADGGGNGDAASQARPAGAPAGLTVVDVRRPAAEPHIERLLVTKVVQLHSSFRAQHAERVS